MLLVYRVYDIAANIFEAYIARIKEVNGTLHMVTELNPDALAIAAQLDAERRAGTTRGYVLQGHYV
jgi:amidase